ncbi:sodium/glutamate symporter [Brevibacterium yomogidense]|uniref:sodium/glutamate symporter n=1 Tax=Brevibacterium yomogidense TaxID=946573 RepID=UPI0018DF54E9|nr:sodium/glutamate symporter [Brevibacterium yomogidense]
MSPDQIGFAILILGLALLIGKAIRANVRWVQKLFLPSSILAGVILLLFGPQVLGQLAGGPLAEAGLYTPGILETWGTLPGLLISVVFATMFLGQDLPRIGHAAKLAGPQVSFGLALGSGQYVIGLLLAIVVLIPLFSASPMVGALIEIGFEGGHGTAAGMSQVFIDLGFESGADLAVGLATVGIVGGIVLGIFLINWAVRKGHTELLDGQADTSVEEQRGLFRKDEHYPAGQMTSRPSSVEPFSLHIAFVSVAILIGWLILQGLTWIESVTYGQTEVQDGVTLELMGNVPLFPLALIGGVILQAIAKALKFDSLIDAQIMLRIQGLALDFLIVAAIANLSLEAIGENLGVFVILSIAGIVFNVVMLLVFAPKVIGRFWFERGIGDFGQSMGVTATGLILMRITDPEGESPAFEAFGYKQLVFEPFFGGGFVTAMAVPLIFFFGPWPLFIGMVALFLIAVVGGMLAFGPQAKREHAERAAGDAPYTTSLQKT